MEHLHYIRQIEGTYISKIHEFKCTHIYREASWVADTLSKHRHKIACPEIYYSIQELPKEANAYFQLD